MERDLQLEVDVVQQAVPVDVLLPAGDQRDPHVVQQEVVDGLRGGPAESETLPGTGQHHQLVCEVDLRLLLVGGPSQPEALRPVGDEERRDEGEDRDGHVEHGGPGQQRGGVEADNGRAPH